MRRLETVLTSQGLHTCQEEAGTGRLFLWNEDPEALRLQFGPDLNKTRRLFPTTSTQKPASILSTFRFYTFNGSKVSFIPLNPTQTWGKNATTVHRKESPWCFYAAIISGVRRSYHIWGLQLLPSGEIGYVDAIVVDALHAAFEILPAAGAWLPRERYASEGYLREKEKKHSHCARRDKNNSRNKRDKTINTGKGRFSARQPKYTDIFLSPKSVAYKCVVTEAHNSIINSDN